MSHKKLVLTALTIAAAFAVALPLLARNENIRSSFRENVTKVESSHVPKSIDTSTHDEPQVVSLELTPSGFQPSETIAHRGKFLILLQNRTGRRDLNFWLAARENGERVAASAPDKRDWKAQVQLGPGTYIIGETNHSEWQFTLRVTN